jgi:hypothetical protein
MFSMILYFTAYRVLLLFSPYYISLFSSVFPLLAFWKHKKCLIFYWRERERERERERAVFFICLPLSHSLVHSLPLCSSQIRAGLCFLHIHFMTHHRTSFAKSVLWSCVHVISNIDKFSIYYACRWRFVTGVNSLDINPKIQQMLVFPLVMVLLSLEGHVRLRKCCGGGGLCRMKHVKHYIPGGAIRLVVLIHVS